MGVEAKITCLLVVLVGVILPAGVVGQGQGQGFGQRHDECFPGEGELVSQSPDGTLLPTVEAFSYSLFQTMSRLQNGSSVILSPYSIWSVLTLAYFGAMGGTQREIENALGFVNKTQAFSLASSLKFFLESGSGDATFNVANRGYFSNRLDLNRCLASEIFDLKRVDFTRAQEARRAINHEVNITTQGRIPELVQFLPPNTRFALINAVFFKGTWETQFDPKFTRPQQFLVPPGKSSGVVDMMNRQDSMIAGEAAGLDAMMVELPYENSEISMFLLLPNNPLAPITDLVLRLNPNTILTAVRSLPQKGVYAHLSLPKFKLTSRFEEDLQTALRAEGISSLFDPSRSNLQGFAQHPPLHVDTAIHQATVEVNEEGTVAAAATAFINTRIGPQRPLVLAFNRPFVFLIVEKTTKLPLFMGTVTSAADLQQL